MTTWEIMSGLDNQPDREEDYRFLHSMLREKKIHLLFKIHERLKLFEKRKPVPVQGHAAVLAANLMEEFMHHGCSDEVTELMEMLSKLHFKMLCFQSLLSVHDAVAQTDYEPTLPPIPDDYVADEDSVKIVSLVKTKEPFGATIKKDESTGAIVIARIMKGGAADKSGLIHEGDELMEVNGVSMEQRKPKEILSLLACSKGAVTFKIIPALYREEVSSQRKQLFVRALFDYNPEEDPAIPCKEAAVGFKRGDILQIVSLEDETWWQACHQGEGKSCPGLVPSQQLHERRVTLQRPRALFRPRTHKASDDAKVLEDVDYRAITGFHIAGLRRSFRVGRKGSVAREVARSRRWSTGLHSSIRPPTYIEVIPYHSEPTDRHRLVVLVGPSGVGVSELKKRLLISDPDCYAVTVPYTTRERKQQETDGVDYHFVPLHKFEEDILLHRFIEYGRYKGHYYGSSLDSVNRVLADSKVCLLDMHPSNIKCVYTAEYRPFVVFVKPPRIEELRLTRRRAKFICEGEDKNPVRTFTEEDFEEMIDTSESMEREYGHLFDKVLVNGDIAVAFRELKTAVLEIIEAEVQWIPTEWVRPSPTASRRSCSHLTGWI